MTPAQKEQKRKAEAMLAAMREQGIILITTDTYKMDKIRFVLVNFLTQVEVVCIPYNNIDILYSFQEFTYHPKMTSKQKNLNVLNMERRRNLIRIINRTSRLSNPNKKKLNQKNLQNLLNL